MYRVVADHKYLLHNKKDFTAIFESFKLQGLLTVYELGQLADLKYRFEDFDLLTRYGELSFYFWRY